MTQAQSFVIEVGGKAVGLVVQEQTGFRFFGSDERYATFERRVFRSPGEAEAACVSHFERNIQPQDTSPTAPTESRPRPAK